MSGYIALPIKRDPADAEATMLEVMRRQYPGWAAADGDPMTFALRSVAVLYGETAELAVRMAEEAFRYFGRGVADVPPQEPTLATGIATISAQDAAGPYVVPDSLELVGRDETGTSRGFRTVGAAVIPNGSTSIDVPVEASEEGEQSNGISGVGELGEFVDYLLPAVTFVGVTAGGFDREDDEPFLDRLRAELRLLTPRPIEPEDFEVLARRFGAYRATAIDGLDPADGTTDNAATIALAVIDEAGVPLDSSEAAAILATLQALREVGWRVLPVVPTSTAIDVSFEFTPYPGWDPEVVRVAAVAAVAAFLSPARWGLRDDTGEDREWLNENTVRRGDVLAAIMRVEGVRSVDLDTLGIAASGGALGDGPVVMPGYAPLPAPGLVVGAVA